jgi:hypothetical protein
MQKKPKTLEEADSKIGLTTNKEKTKTMCLNEEKIKLLKPREEAIEEVDEFIYMGSIIAKKNGTAKDAEKE